MASGSESIVVFTGENPIASSLHTYSNSDLATVSTSLLCRNIHHSYSLTKVSAISGRSRGQILAHVPDTKIASLETSWYHRRQQTNTSDVWFCAPFLLASIVWSINFILGFFDYCMLRWLTSLCDASSLFCHEKIYDLSLSFEYNGSHFD